jgi:hypothetical protein
VIAAFSNERHHLVTCPGGIRRAARIQELANEAVDAPADEPWFAALLGTRQSLQEGKRQVYRRRRIALRGSSGCVFSVFLGIFNIPASHSEFHQSG